MPLRAVLPCALLWCCVGAGGGVQERGDTHEEACAASVSPVDPQCRALRDAPGAPGAPAVPLRADSSWLAPLHARVPRGPAAGALLAAACLAWLLLLAIATFVRPRGWRHEPLFSRLRGHPGGGA